MVTLLAFAFVLGVLVFVHELGHFLDARIGFPAIAHVIEQTMAAHTPAEVTTLAQVRAVDAWAREQATGMAREVQLKV